MISFKKGQYVKVIANDGMRYIGVLDNIEQCQDEDDLPLTVRYLDRGARVQITYCNYDDISHITNYERIRMFDSETFANFVNTHKITAEWLNEFCLEVTE